MVSLRRHQHVDHPPRSLARKGLIGVNVLLALIILFGVAAFGYANWRFGQVGRFSLSALGDSPGSVMNVLLVGSDSRADLAEGESGSFGNTSQVAGQRADTIMILHVDPKQEKASILSIPRDTWVTNANTGRNSKINDAFLQGPDGLISTIRSNFNIPIDHYAQVDFDGFKGMVDAIGGVTIRFDAPARDQMAGLDIRTAGCQKLDGTQALAYARSRYYQTKLDGRWVSDPRSDLSRIDRQQDFIRRVMRKAVSSASNPITLNNLISNGVKNVKLDDGFSLNDIRKVAQRFRSLDPNTVEMMTLPTTSAKRQLGGVTVDAQIPNQKEVTTTVDRFLNGPPKAEAVADIPPSSISMRVLNGSGVTGQAADASASLKDFGFVVSGTGDGTKRNSTVVQYAPGNEDKARVIASYIGGTVTVAEDRTVKGVDAVVVTGSAFSGVTDPKATTTTTAPPAVTAPTTSTTASPFVPSGSC